MIKSYVKFALTNLKYRKVRTILTVLGIIIGIATIVSLISVSEGLQSSITEQFEKMGANRIYVSGKISFTSGSMGQSLTNDDVDTVEKIKEVEWVQPYLMSSAKANFGREEKLVYSVVGIPPENSEEKWTDMDVTLKEGRFFRGGDKFVCIVGSAFAEDYFDKKVRLNSKLELGDYEFEVVGILNEIGNTEDDNMVQVPIETARTLFNMPKEITAIEVKIKEGYDLKTVSEKMKKDLEKARNNENFEVMTPEQILRQLSQMLMIIQIILVGIAAISLVVGAVGILNSMYTTVLERTKEIGIMKSIGATNKNILYMFMFESGMQGFFGGLVGGVLGILISKVIGKIIQAAGFGMLKVGWNLPLMGFGILFAVLVSIISGYLPAKQAANLKPREAFSQ